MGRATLESWDIARDALVDLHRVDSRMTRRRVAVLTVKSSSEVGGAERFFGGLVGGLRGLGVETERVDVESDESSFETIEESYLRFYDLDLSSYDGVISTKAPSYAARHPNHICYLMHTMRVFYDMFDEEYPNAPEWKREQRAQVHRMDTAALGTGRIRALFAIGREVAMRLATYNRLQSTVIHHGLNLEGPRPRAYDYAFLPGRLHRWKRVDLVIQALKRVERPLRLLITGTGEDERHFRSQAGDDPRIAFLGRVSDERLLSLYADALVVPFVPVREDYGLVTLEAFRASKPVITCTDSGEPTVFVRDGETGFCCAPEPGEIADRMTWFFDHPNEAAAMGARAAASVRHLRWDVVCSRLLEPLFPGEFARTPKD
jgi:glycosyltransferase involved in cell wall biosynthesis